ncbi:hypothetical protein [Schinkia azotoformans]|uniref:hypothetical protein n=1 Tax=Schinkia azotoformans TaxID=1454 RepID=UPI002DBFD1A3|nr:hypothetical protein [Schinkia azotoformans]MEC1772824.1 hypothetical protein [Schinkia azotoformans]MED4367457.1 hypothetical protein [Schinkia azotoformans]
MNDYKKIAYLLDNGYVKEDDLDYLTFKTLNEMYISKVAYENKPDYSTTTFYLVIPMNINESVIEYGNRIMTKFGRYIKSIDVWDIFSKKDKGIKEISFEFKCYQDSFYDELMKEIARGV